MLPPSIQATIKRQCEWVLVRCPNSPDFNNEKNMTQNEILKCFYTCEPQGNLLAIYSDISGAEYFYQQAIGQWRNDEVGIVDKDYFVDAGFLYFIEDK